MNKTKIQNLCAALAVAGVAALSTLLSACTTPQMSDFDKIHAVYLSPNTYLGKTLTVGGYYSSSLLQEDGTLAEPEAGVPVYHFLSAYDDGDCHHVSIEFTMSTGEYPEVGEYLTITGVLSTYLEDGATYYTITA